MGHAKRIAHCICATLLYAYMSSCYELDIYLSAGSVGRCGGDRPFDGGFILVIEAQQGSITKMLVLHTEFWV